MLWRMLWFLWSVKFFILLHLFIPDLFFVTKLKVDAHTLISDKKFIGQKQS